LTGRLRRALSFQWRHWMTPAASSSGWAKVSFPNYFSRLRSSSGGIAAPLVHCCGSGWMGPWWDVTQVSPIWGQ
jgi:hypothetical protein